MTLSYTYFFDRKLHCILLGIGTKVNRVQHNCLRCDSTDLCTLYVKPSISHVSSYNISS